MSYKKTDALMRHLRNNGIHIGGSSQKRQLINTGYYHGYKGYRFFKSSHKKLPFVSYAEIYATIQYDSKLKALFYPQVMFIETAIKNISLTCILEEAGSENIQDMYDKIVCSYHNCPPNSTQKNKQELQEKKLELQSRIYLALKQAYKVHNPKITHFYNNMGYHDVPLWALFEILTMGNFGYLLSCLTYSARDAISKRIGLNLSVDTNRCLIYKYVFALKDLRNAIAHNAVIFDTRFKTMDPNHAMKQCLCLELKLPYVNFKTIGDYLMLICYLLKLLQVPKTEIKAFIREFEKITAEYKKAVNPQVAGIVVHPDLPSRINLLKNYLQMLNFSSNNCIIYISIGVYVFGHILEGAGAIRLLRLFSFPFSLLPLPSPSSTYHKTTALRRWFSLISFTYFLFLPYYLFPSSLFPITFLFSLTLDTFYHNCYN